MQTYICCCKTNGTRDGTLQRTKTNGTRDGTLQGTKTNCTTDGTLQETKTNGTRDGTRQLTKTNGTGDGTLQGTKTNGTRYGTLQGNTTVFVFFVKCLPYRIIIRISGLVLESLHFALSITIPRTTIFATKPERKLRYELDSRQILVRFPTGARDLTLLQSIPTSSWAHPTPYSMGIGQYFPTRKGIGAQI